MTERPCTLERIAAALVRSGYTSLDAQAKALGLPRSTAWTIVKSKHKLGRLSYKVRQRMLTNPDLPCEVRTALETDRELVSFSGETGSCGSRGRGGGTDRGYPKSVSLEALGGGK